MSNYLSIILVSAIFFVACGDEDTAKDSSENPPSQTQSQSSLDEATVKDSSENPPSQTQSQSSLQGNRNDVVHRTNPIGICVELSGLSMQQALQDPRAQANLQQDGYVVGSCPNSFQGFAIAKRCNPVNVPMEGDGQMTAVLNLYSNVLPDPSQGDQMCQQVNAGLSQGG